MSARPLDIDDPRLSKRELRALRFIPFQRATSQTGFRSSEQRVGEPGSEFVRSSRSPRVSDKGTENTRGIDTGSAFQEQAEVLPPLVRRPALPSPERRFELLHQWEGIVASVLDREFVATMKDRSTPENPDEEIAFSIDEVPEGDLELMHQGATFYWSIGYQENMSGQRMRVSRIRFQRIPAWTKRDIDAVRKRTEELKKLFAQCE